MFLCLFSLFKILIEQKAAESSQIDWMSNFDLENTMETKHSRLCDFSKCEPTSASVFLLFNQIKSHMFIVVKDSPRFLIIMLEHYQAKQCNHQELTIHFQNDAL